MNFMFKKAILPLAVLFALSACGGGSSSSVNSLSGASALSNSLAAISTFADNGGVAAGNATDTDDGEELRVLIIGPQISETVSALNTLLTDSNNADLDFDNATSTNTLADGSTVEEGTTTFDGDTLDFAAVTDRNQEALVAAFGDANSSFVLVFGEAMSGSLVGSHTYTGTFGMGETGPIANIDLGSFTMTADFGGNTYTFTGATNGGDTLTGSGSFNLEYGTFTSSTFTAVNSGTSSAATVYGQFHGNGGSSVSGVFHTNEATPTHHGGFAGSR